MFTKLQCVCLYTKDIEKSRSFYNSMGMLEHWKLERPLEDGTTWTLIGFTFPHKESSELVISNHPKINFTEVEIHVGDVCEFYNEFSKNQEITWIRTPFATESGHVAVMEAPDENVFVLVGK
jgi:catechol 2,3-dioxygenase-like lactoylglutathione lyase family enzyme